MITKLIENVTNAAQCGCVMGGLAFIAGYTPLFIRHNLPALAPLAKWNDYRTTCRISAFVAVFFVVKGLYNSYASYGYEIALECRAKEKLSPQWRRLPGTLLTGLFAYYTVDPIDRHPKNFAIGMLIVVLVGKAWANL